MSNSKVTNSQSLARVTEQSPCIHCGKPDWCYGIGDLTVCKRPVDPAPGWERTTKKDKEGSYYLAPIQVKKAPRPTGKKEYFYGDRQGNKLVRVTHTYVGGKKKGCPQASWDASKKRWLDSVPDEIKPHIPIYRYLQIKEAVAQGKTIFLVEGEGKAESLVGLGLEGTSFIGGAGKYSSYGDYKKDLEGADLVLCPDRDKPGVKHMEQVAIDFPAARWLYAPPSQFFWVKLAESGGLDVGDWIEEGATVEDINKAITDKKPESLQPLEVESDETEPLDFSFPEAEEIFTQKATAALFGDTNWISLNEHLHRWSGTHYELVADASIRAKIAHWCASTPVQHKDKRQYDYAQSSFVENIWRWVHLAFAVDPALVNPPGINCLNGSLKLHWEGRKVTWKLHPHEPNDFYICCSPFKYNPKADPTQCDRLLACLQPEQQDIYLKTLAASLDLSTIRKYRSRVKAIICQGHGNNGKDSLREAATYLYSSGMTAATISDFQIYDGGKKFPLAKLEHSLINWSSENSSFKNIDTLESLKAAITGEPLAVERKNLDERPMLLNTVFLFNMNESPTLQAGSEAIQSRWAVLTFDKTYKVGADPNKGELEADSRFRYDPEFLQTEVVPALLNKILEALPRLVKDGINYDCTQKALETIQKETNHLWAFASDIGLDYRQEGRVYIKELWEKLREWYVANGTLELHKITEYAVKEEWHNPVNLRDKNVRGANQVYQRFSVLFPKINRVRDSQSPDKKGQWYLGGIAIGEAVSEAGEAISEAVGEAATRPQSGSEAGEAVEHTLLQLLTQIQTLEPLELRKIMLKIKNRSNVGQTASLASLVDIARAVASPTASPTASLASLEAIQKMNFTQSSAVTHSPARDDSEVKSGDNINKLSSDNTSIFLPPTPSCFKVGDKCRVTKKCWQIPMNKELTITKIEGAIATVRYKGCMSHSGVEVELCYLEPLSE